MNASELLQQAKGVLDANWRGTHTIPAPGLYPHQWSWDSGFIAIGLSHYHQERAQKELLTLFEAQWGNGFLPHIVFNPEERSYFPDPSYWNCKGLCPQTPQEYLTSGLTQPPVHALAAWYIYRNARDKSGAVSFLKEIFPRLTDLHRYLFSKRDPEGCGLASIYHPWESGQDNLPCWDEPLSRVMPVDLPSYRRVDVERVGSQEERPSDEDYDRYIHIVEVLKSARYDDEAAYPIMPFLIKDLCMNTILHLSTRSLYEMARLLNRDTREIEGWLEKLREGLLERLWDPEDGLFYSYDLRRPGHIRKRTISSLIPLSTGVLEKTDARRLLEWLNHSNFCGDCNCKYPFVPSSGVEEPDFQSVTYWRGPVWINMNWLIIKGLIEYDMIEKCEEIKQSLFQLAEESGFREYYDPFTGDGHGAGDFSWSAALIIDLLMSDGVK